VRATAGLAAVALVGGAFAARLDAQISPGPLAAPHQQLEGALRCVVCHEVGRKNDMNGRCLQCHKEIGWLVAGRRGLHARVQQQRCAACHPDHAGRAFALITWPDSGGAARFDHARAGWPLEGRHATAKCGDCHKPESRVSAAARLSARRGPEWGWVGLEPGCVTCHADAHRGALGNNCLTCHDVAHWKPAPRFDHARTDYPLTGAHERVSCAACHLAPRLQLASDRSGKPIPQYRPLAHRECAPCHADPHTGRLGNACNDCHVTTAFQTISRGKFDHDSTRYPLRGRHAAVACDKCHEFAAGGRVIRDPPFATCTGCHRDAHAGAATLAGRVVDCSACHAVAGWQPATFTVAQHRLTTYPLEGKHQQVECAACHVKNPPGVPAAALGPAQVWLRPVATACRACHSDDHGGQLASRPDSGACAACHTVAGWRPSTFTAAAHATLRLRLDGRHAEIPCRACHGPGRQGLTPLAAGTLMGKAGVAMRPPEVECVSCHVDPHAGREPRCLDCHDTRAFRPSRIDVAAHRRYRFPLDGAHAATSCVTCHRELQHPATAGSLVLARWTFPPMKFTTPAGAGCAAAGCHSNPHGGQFAGRPDRGACESCHGTDAFRPAARFDHDRDASFALKGAHANVPCDRCHKSDRGPGGKPVTVYRPVSGKCESCHGDGAKRGDS